MQRCGKEKESYYIDLDPPRIGFDIARWTKSPKGILFARFASQCEHVYNVDNETIQDGGGDIGGAPVEILYNDIQRGFYDEEKNHCFCRIEGGRYMIIRCAYVEILDTCHSMHLSVCITRHVDIFEDIATFICRDERTSNPLLNILTYESSKSLEHNEATNETEKYNRVSKYIKWYESIYFERSFFCATCNFPHGDASQAKRCFSIKKKVDARVCNYLLKKQILFITKNCLKNVKKYAIVYTTKDGSGLFIQLKHPKWKWEIRWYLDEIYILVANSMGKPKIYSKFNSIFGKNYTPFYDDYIDKLIEKDDFSKLVNNNIYIPNAETTILKQCRTCL